MDCILASRGRVCTCAGGRPAIAGCVQGAVWRRAPPQGHLHRTDQCRRAAHHAGRRQAGQAPPRCPAWLRRSTGSSALLGCAAWQASRRAPLSSRSPPPGIAASLGCTCQDLPGTGAEQSSAAPAALTRALPAACSSRRWAPLPRSRWLTRCSGCTWGRRPCRRSPRPVLLRAWPTLCWRDLPRPCPCPCPLCYTCSCSVAPPGRPLCFKLRDCFDVVHLPACMLCNDALTGGGNPEEEAVQRRGRRAAAPPRRPPPPPGVRAPLAASQHGQQDCHLQGKGAARQAACQMGCQLPRQLSQGAAAWLPPSPPHQQHVGHRRSERLG